MAERMRIANYFAPLATGEAGSFHLLDDAALLTPPPGKSLILTTDSVIEGIHLPHNAAPQYYAQKIMRRNLSDLAAMGAEPWRYTLNFHTSHKLASDWVALFAATLAKEQQQFGMTLIGGDTTSGDGLIHLSLTCIGLIEGEPLRRQGAAVGDEIYVSGTLGDAAFALQQLLAHAPLDETLKQRYYAPEPRLALGQMLRGTATAAMDISDGLLADLAQLCDVNQVGATINQDALPLHPIVAEHIEHDAQGWQWPLSGGDDYELLFTAAPQQRARVESIAAALGLRLTPIGTIDASQEVRVIDVRGNPIHAQQNGWEYR